MTCFLYFHIISIHAPVRGATSFVFSSYCMTLYFNPRSREGSDDILRADGGESTYISIHAPVRGATEATDYELEEQTFQSTLP